MTRTSGTRLSVARALGSGLLGIGLLASVLPTFAQTGSPPSTEPLEQPTSLHLFPDRQPVGVLNLSDPGKVPGIVTSPPAYPLRPLWELEVPREHLYTLRQSERSTPALAGDRLLVGTSRARGILVIDPSTGWLQRRIMTRGPVEAPIRVAAKDRNIYVGDTAGFFYRLRPDGSKVWEYESIGPIFTAATLDEERVYLRAVDGSVVALDRDSGKQLWTYRREARLGTDLSIFGESVPMLAGELLIAGFDDGSVAAVRASDGVMVWERQLLSDGQWMDVDGDPLVLEGDRVVISAYQGPTVCLKASSGEELWRASYGGSSQPVYADGRLFIADASGWIVALSPSTGERLWRWPVNGGAVPRQPVLWRDTLIVTTSVGDLVLLDPSTGVQLWRMRPEEEIAGFSSAVMAHDASLYAITDGGRVIGWVAPDFVKPPSRTRGGRWQLPWEREK